MASWPFSFRLAKYCRCTGRTAAIFSLSWMYSMTAANFMASSNRWRGQGGLLGLARGCQGMQPEQDRREQQVADEGAAAIEGDAGRITLQQASQVAAIEMGVLHPGLQVCDQKELSAAQQRCRTDAQRRI